MVSSGFRRSISFPGSPRAKPRPRLAGRHARSISLPSSRPHPVLFDLHDVINSLTTWQAQLDRSSAWLCAGLAQIELLHDSLDDLFHLPSSHDFLACSAEKLLEDFLLLADIFGTFRSLLLSMQQYCSEAQAALRRDDAARMASCMRSMKKAEKELVVIASTLHKSSLSPAQSDFVGEITRVMRMSASASTSVFMGVATLLSSASKSSFAVPTSNCMIAMFKRKNKNNKLEKKEEEEEERKQKSLDEMADLEECVVALENRTERLFKLLVNTRVSLLNTMTPSL